MGLLPEALILDDHHAALRVDGAVGGADDRGLLRHHHGVVARVAVIRHQQKGVRRFAQGVAFQDLLPAVGGDGLPGAHRPEILGGHIGNGIIPHGNTAAGGGKGIGGAHGKIGNDGAPSVRHGAGAGVAQVAVEIPVGRRCERAFLKIEILEPGENAAPSVGIGQTHVFRSRGLDELGDLHVSGLGIGKIRRGRPGQGQPVKHRPGGGGAHFLRLRPRRQRIAGKARPFEWICHVSPPHRCVCNVSDPIVPRPSADCKGFDAFSRFIPSGLFPPARRPLPRTGAPRRFSTGAEALPETAARARRFPRDFPEWRSIRSRSATR